MLDTLKTMFHDEPTTGKLYFGKEASRRKRAFKEASEIIAGERRLIDSKYVWHWVALTAVGTGAFMFAVGFLLRSLLP